MRTAIKICGTCLTVTSIFVTPAIAQTKHLTDQNQAAVQKGLAESMRTAPTHGNRQTPQVFRAGRNADCTLNIGSSDNKAAPNNHLPKSPIAPKQQNIYVQGNTIVVCGR